MERFSDDLRRERERQQVSLETMSQITKISQRHLLELEAGDFASLPGGVFRKGILRSYLSTLQLDPAPWLNRFEQCLAALEQPATASGGIAEFAENISRNRPETLREPTRWPGVLAMLLLLLVFGWCVWHFALRGHVLLTRARFPEPTCVTNLSSPLYLSIDIARRNRLTQSINFTKRVPAAFGSVFVRRSATAAAGFAPDAALTRTGTSQALRSRF